jgi:hypothetical protein
MATTVTKTNYWLLKLTSDTTPVFKFKFVVDIFVNNLKQVRLKIPKNQADSAHVSFEKVVRNYLTNTNKHANTITGAIDYDSIHLIPQNTTDSGGGTIVDFPLSKQENTCKLVTFIFYEEYATTASGNVTVTASSTAPPVTYAVLNYANEWEDAMILDLNLFEFDGVEPATLGRYLTQLPYDDTNPNSTSGKVAHLTSYNDYKTLTSINGNSTYFDVDDTRIILQFFEEAPIYQTLAGATIATNHVAMIQFPNEAAYGGTRPVNANTEDEMLLYLGIGGANVKNIKFTDFGGYQLTESSDIKYYSVYQGTYTTADSIVSTNATNIKIGEYIEVVTVGTTDYTTVGGTNIVGNKFYATGTPTGNGTIKKLFRQPKSETYLFEITSDNNCNSTRFDEYSLAWKNKYGTWDYYMFDGEHTENASFKREIKQKRIAGTWNAADFSLEPYERGNVQKITGKKSVTINTRYITDNYNQYFEGLMMSDNVLLLSPVDKGDDNVKAEPIPVNITNNALRYKTNLKDKTVQYSFNIEFAHSLKQRS